MTAEFVVPTAFARFGLQHLSPSTCNKFLGSPAMFVLDKVLQMPNGVGPAAHRGTAVEDGLTYGLLHPEASIADCIEVARAKFAQLVPDPAAHPKGQKELDAIPGMVGVAVDALRPYGRPTGTQVRVSVDVEGLAVPIIGFVDFEWAQHDLLLDLKTTHACPSEIKADHARQVSLYVKARGRKEGRLSYNTPKRSATYLLENVDYHFNYLCKVGFAIQRFLSLTNDKAELASLVAPDLDSFYFDDPVTRQSAFEVWGL